MVDATCPQCGSSEYDRDRNRGYRLYCPACGFSPPNAVDRVPYE